MKTCKYCHSDIHKEAKICPNCRKRQSNKTIYIILSIIGIIIILMSITIPIIINSKKTIKEDNQNTANTLFSSQVLLFNGDILNNCIILEEIANDIKSYWYASIYEDKYNGDIDDAVAQALKDHKENIETVKNNKENITKNYNKIKYLECYSVYCQDIKNNVSKIYDSYLNFYDLATNPSGSYTEFSNSFSSINTETMEYFDNITELLNLFNENQ